MTTPMTERAAKDALVRYSRLVYDKGWVANHDGNLTARVGAARILATPTAFSKADVDQQSLVVVDGSGKKIAGQNRPFSELVLHLAVYDRRADVQAVVHAHPPYATAMACAGVGLDAPFMPEAVVSIGPRVPLVPFAAPGSPEFVGHLVPLVSAYDVVMLEGHGVLAWGDDVQQAFLRLELVEHLARMATLAQSWGGVRLLPSDVVARLLDARKRAGLGPAARGVEVPPELQAGAVMASSLGVRNAAGRVDGSLPAGGSDELGRIILEELGALLGRR